MAEDAKKYHLYNNVMSNNKYIRVQHTLDILLVIHLPAIILTFIMFVKKIENSSANKQAFISEKYLGLIRNFKRELWLISYLFVASPALCQSFLQVPVKNIFDRTLIISSLV